MTTPTGMQGDLSARPGRRRTVLVAVAVLALVFWAGRASGSHARWETMDAELYDEGRTVVFVDDAGQGRYEFRSSVPWWYDAAGVRHDGGMPDCLAPVGIALPSWENVREDVHFAWVPVGGVPSPRRAVVGVDCSA